MPSWQLTILIEQEPALAAAELLDRITAATAPYLEKNDRRYLLEMLQDVAGIEKPIRKPMPIEEYDPKKAAEHFRAQGMIVVESA